MARRKVKFKPSFLVQPDPLVDKKYVGWEQSDIQNEIDKCKTGIEGLKYFINAYIYVPNKIKPEILKEKPKWFKHIQFENEKVNLKLYPKQEEYLKTLFENRLTASYKSRQTGISTITQAFILQYAIFNENKEIVIISKTEAEAIKFLDSIYYMFNHLPFFLRRQYSKAVKKSFHIGSLNKATKINVLTSTSKSGRSFSATILILDEAEFIEHVDDLWAAAQPTLSATGGQAIVISTPWQYKSWFWKICHGEDEDAFKTFKINWSDIPGRDKEQYKAQCAELGHDRLKIMTELDMKWIVPFQRYYMEDMLSVDYVIKQNDFNQYKEDYGLGIIHSPVEGMEYYFGLDTYEGGKDFNAGIIIGEDMKVYAYFKTQRLDIFDLVKFLCDFYKTKVCVERNRGFQIIKEFQSSELDKKYVLFKVKKIKQTFVEEFGFLINGENRKRLIATTSEWLKHIHNNNQDENKEKILIPEALMDEMNYFVIKKSKVEGVEHDDLIFALIAALYVRDNKHIFYNQKSFKKSGTMDLVNEFYKNTTGGNDRESMMFKNGKLNTLMARNFLVGARGNKSLTPDDLDLFEKVLIAGKQEADKKREQSKEQLT